VLLQMMMLLLLLQLGVQQGLYGPVGAGMEQQLAWPPAVLLAAGESGCWVAECAGKSDHAQHTLQAVAG
jgi:hypothetical protein